MVEMQTQLLPVPVSGGIRKIGKPLAKPRDIALLVGVNGFIFDLSVLVSIASLFFFFSFFLPV